MGFPVSTVVANLYMEYFFKEIALNSALLKPRVMTTIVNANFCIVKKGTVNHLLDHLDTVRPIKYIMKSED